MDLPIELQPDDKTTVQLSSSTVDLPVCHPSFLQWNGAPLLFDFGRKPVLNFRDRAIFAELLILRILQRDGWDGAWIETYGGTHYLQDMPSDWKLQSNDVLLPEAKEALLKEIWRKGETKACFDVLAWKDDNVLFCEAKRKNKDTFTKAQYKFIDGALACGIKPEQLLIVEWNFTKL